MADIVLTDALQDSKKKEMYKNKYISFFILVSQKRKGADGYGKYKVFEA